MHKSFPNEARLACISSCVVLQVNAKGEVKHEESTIQQHNNNNTPALTHVFQHSEGRCHILFQQRNGVFHDLGCGVHVLYLRFSNTSQDFFLFLQHKRVVHCRVDGQLRGVTRRSRCLCPRVCWLSRSMFGVDVFLTKRRDVLVRGSINGCRGLPQMPLRRRL